MANVFNEPRRPSEFILSEGNGWISRDHVLLLTGTKYEHAVPLGKVTATGKMKLWAPAATDGSQNFAGVLIEGRDATLGDKRAAAMVRNCELNGLLINWPVGMTAPQRDAFVASALSAGVVIRFGV